MKVMKKQLIKNAKQKFYTLSEMNIMKNFSNPFLVKLHYSFQDDEKLYFIMDFMQGGLF